MSLLPRRTAVVVFLTFAFAYFFSALLRAITATLSPVLTVEFAMSAQELGLLAGGYFLGFAATQIPMGAWLDRHGPRKVVLSLLSLAVLGCIAFSLATGFTGLLAARVLCGVGVSACLMAPLTGYRRWFDATTQLRTNSWMLMTGSLGMVASTLPVQWLLPVMGWRALFWGIAAMVLLSGAWIALAVPGWNRPLPAAQWLPADHDTSGYAVVWRHPYFRRVAPMGFFTYGGMVAMQTLWAGPWMQRVAHYCELEAAPGLFWINVSMLCTFGAWGLLGPWMARHRIDVNRVMAGGLPFSLCVLLAILVLGPQAGSAAWALYCVSCTVMALSLPAVAAAFDVRVAGRALSAYNLVVFGGVFVLQWGIGLAVDGFLAAGLDVLGAFRAALGLYLLCNLLAWLWFLRKPARP